MQKFRRLTFYNQYQIKPKGKQHCASHCLLRHTSLHQGRTLKVPSLENLGTCTYTCKSNVCHNQHSGIGINIGLQICPINIPIQGSALLYTVKRTILLVISSPLSHFVIVLRNSYVTTEIIRLHWCPNNHSEQGLGQLGD